MVVADRVLLSLLWIAGCLLGGCALTESSTERALITSTTGDIRAVATRADRRITFVDENWMWGEDRERENVAYRMTMTSTLSAADKFMFDSYQAHHYCAEPSPDISEQMLTKLGGHLGTRAQGLEAQRLTESDSEPLLRRSQGVQLFRDGLFALCQAHHNGAVGSEDYGLFIGSLIERASYLITLELALARRDTDSSERVAIVESALSHLKPRRLPPSTSGVPGIMALSGGQAGGQTQELKD